MIIHLVSGGKAAINVPMPDGELPQHLQISSIIWCEQCFIAVFNCFEWQQKKWTRLSNARYVWGKCMLLKIRSPAHSNHGKEIFSIKSCQLQPISLSSVSFQIWTVSSKTSVRWHLTKYSSDNGRFLFVWLKIGQNSSSTNSSPLRNRNDKHFWPKH